MKKSKMLVTVHNHRIEYVEEPEYVTCICGEMFTSFIQHADHVVMKLFDAEDEEKDNERS